MFIIINKIINNNNKNYYDGNMKSYSQNGCYFKVTFKHLQITKSYVKTMYNIL